MRREHLFIGALLTAGGLATVGAASLPDLLPVWRAKPQEAIALIGPHLTEWQVSSWLFGIGAVLTLAGLAALTPKLGQPANLGLTLISLATALWVSNVAFRLTVTTQLAQRQQVPDWYVPVHDWTVGLLLAAAATTAAALLCYATAILSSAVLPRWTGWATAAGALVVAALFVTTGNVPPIVMYLAPLAVGIGALSRQPVRA